MHSLRKFLNDPDGTPSGIFLLLLIHFLILIRFLVSKAQKWYLLNDGTVYFMNWLGISWINIPYILKMIGIYLAISVVCLLINAYFGLFIAVVLELPMLGFLGKTGFDYLLNMSKYCHWKAFSQALCPPHNSSHFPSWIG